MTESGPMSSGPDTQHTAMFRKVFLCIFVSSAAAVAMATGDFYDAFVAHYKVPESSALAAKSCAVCHVSDSDFAMNPYGDSIKAKLKAEGKEAVDGAILASIEADDSDGDGNDNKTEIAANTLPGDPKSGAKEGVVVKEKPKEPESMIPKNAFHPAIVHFPIALFIAGLVLDALGMFKNDKTLLLAGWYNLIFAALTAFGGIASGAMAMIFKGYPFAGTMQNHIILAIVSTVLMWAMVSMRVHKHEEMKLSARVVYYLLATAAFILISWAGHAGGDLVYG